MEWTDSYRSFTVETYFKTQESISLTLKTFTINFKLNRNVPLPANRTIRRWVQNFRSTSIPGSELILAFPSASFSWLRMCSWNSAPIAVRLDEPGVGLFYLKLSGFRRFWELTLLILESWNKFRLRKTGESRSIAWRRSKLYNNFDTFGLLCPIKWYHEYSCICDTLICYFVGFNLAQSGVFQLLIWTHKINLKIGRYFCRTLYNLKKIFICTRLQGYTQKTPFAA